MKSNIISIFISLILCVFFGQSVFGQAEIPNGVSKFTPQVVFIGGELSELNFTAQQ